MLTVIPIPAFSDNYIWCIICHQSQTAAVVDPGQSGPVNTFLSDNDLSLRFILTTHHHPDHIGGVDALKKEHDCEVIGFNRANFTGIDITVEEGSSVELFGTSFDVLEVPGHTLDHIAYFSNADSTHDHPWLFCGDTLFSGGCGRLFEGSPEMMLHSLSKFVPLPEDTRVYCAHEYTLANLRFAQSIMPDKQALEDYHQQCRHKRERGEPTLPSTLKIEKAINPFLRSDDPVLQKHFKVKNEDQWQAKVACFAKTRQAKDQF